MADSILKRAFAEGRRITADALLAAPWLYRPLLKLVGYDASHRGKLTDLSLDNGFLAVPVHFYQPVPDIGDLEARRIWAKKSQLGGVDFQQDNQVRLLRSLGEEYGAECDWPVRPTADHRDFYTDNGGFSYGCAASTHMMIRHYQPERIIEIGSGNSSRVIAGALRLNGSGRHTIVDPCPGEALRKGLGAQSQLLQERVELQDSWFFDQLECGDVLFIDSGHTVRIGGDVNFEFLDVLPTLRPGVVVHIHDVLLPYEYPKVYATQNVRYFWTEQYMLQAFLAFNREFEVLLAMYYLERDHNEDFQAALPLYNPIVHTLMSSSFWIRRRD